MSVKLVHVPDEHREAINEWLVELVRDPGKATYCASETEEGVLCELVGMGIKFSVVWTSRHAVFAVGSGERMVAGLKVGRVKGDERALRMLAIGLGAQEP